MTSVYAGHLTTGEHAPRDENGAPLPNSSFILYQLGTTTPPVYYSDRIKSSTVPGPPTTDDKGNVDAWVEPGIYEYWFDGEKIQTVSVEEDNSEDDVALAAAIAAINASHYTKSEIDNLIASTGFVTGAELQANKNQNDGYLGLDGSGIAETAHLPTSATTSARTPTAHFSSHLPGGSDYLPPGTLIGSHVTKQYANYTANFGDVVVFVPDGASADTVTLPDPIANERPVTVVVSGEILEAPAMSIVIGSDTFTLAPSSATSPTWVAGAVMFVPSADSWQAIATDAATSEFLTYSTFQLGQINNPIQIVTDPSSSVALGSTGENFTRYVYTDPSLNTAILSQNAPVGQEIEIVQAQGAGQVHLTIGGTGSIFEPDNYKYTARPGSRVGLFVESNSDGVSAQWVAGGETAPLGGLTLATMIYDTFANRPAANAVIAQTQFFATDRKEMWQSDGATWTLRYGVGSTNLLIVAGGQYALPRIANNGDTISTSNQILKLTYFRAQKTQSISSITSWLGTTPAAATPTLSKYGLWTATENGALTGLVASTANDTALFTGSAHAIKTKATQAAYTLIKEQYYAVGALVVSGAAMPNWGGCFVGTDLESGDSERWAGQVTGQSDLPSTVAAGSVADASSVIQFRLT